MNALPPAAPSLLSTAPANAETGPAAPPDARNLLDLMVDGFYMLFLLKNRYRPVDADTLRARLREFLIAFERGTKRLDSPADDVHQAKYAFCALVDEVVLMSPSSVRDSWQQRPLQLELFGEQLAGEHFFDRLDALRQQGPAKLQVLEVFHMCLLAGFQGKYLLEGSEKLNYLTARLGDDIALMKGKRSSFAPHWAPPDRIAHRLRTEVPLWAAGAVFALAGLTAFIGLRWQLDRQTRQDLAAYAHIIQMPAQAAFVTISWP